MRVLGVDPGLTRCGVGIVDGVPGRPCALVAYHVVYTDPADELPLRLLHLDRTLADLIAEHRPQSVAVERVFSQHNVRTVMGTAQAGAVAVLAAARAGLPMQLYTPSEVKAAVTGSGQAGKAQVTAMVTRLLGLDSPPRPADAADALALAVCHVWRGGTRAKLSAAAAKVAGAQREAQREAQRRAARKFRAAVEASRVEAARTKAARVRASHVEASGVEASRVEASRVEASRVEAVTVRASGIEAGGVEASKVKASGVGGAGARVGRAGGEVR